MELFWFVVGFIFGRFGKFILGFVALMLIIGFFNSIFS